MFAARGVGGIERILQPTVKLKGVVCGHESRPALEETIADTVRQYMPVQSFEDVRGCGGLDPVSSADAVDSVRPAVSATTVSNAVFGNYPAFNLPSVQMVSLWDLVPVVLLGIAAGVVSAMFIQSTQSVAARAARLPIEGRLLLSK